jgi:hypothetical protein
LKNYGTVRKLITALLVGCMAVSTVGCANSNNSSSKTSGNSGETTEISMLVQGTTKTWQNYPNSRVMKAMEKATGTKLKMITADADKVNVLLASGDLPDIVRVDTSKFNQLIEGNNVIALDSLLSTNGKDIQNNIATTLEFSKKYWSDDKNQTYFLPVQVGADGIGMEQNFGIVTRWDYYKELNYPEISSVDDELTMLADMVKNHSTTADGKKVYAVSAFSDWDNWIYTYPMAAITGFYQTSSKTEVLNVDTNVMSNTLLDENAPFWQTVEFMYKANNMGILDPDSFTQKYEDFTTKASNGQILSLPAVWADGGFTSNNASKGNGFVVLPLDWGYQWGEAQNLAGWTDKCYAITSNSKNQEKAMDLLNYLYSYGGLRTLYSGIEGTDWDDNGVTDSALKLKQNGGDAWDETGIGFDTNFTGISGFATDPDDNKPLNLFQDSEAYPKMLTALQKDYSDHYGVTYPNEIFKKKLDEGKVKNQSGENTLALALMPSATDEISRIDAKLDTLLITYGAKLVLAGSEDNFNSIKTEAMAAFKSAGAEKVDQWYQENWSKSVEEASTIK